MMEIPSTTELSPKRASSTIFCPNMYVDITEVWKEKEKLLNIYVDEIPSTNHSRSIEIIKAKAKIRGGEIGCEMAEGFVSLQRVL